MGIHQGSISLCRYRLLGSGAKVSLARLNDFFEPYKAAPLKLSGVFKEEITGWVRPVGIDKVDLPEDTPWGLGNAQVDDGFLLRMRVEKRKVPAQLLQLVYRQRFFELQAKGGKTPGPKERRELRETVKKELMARALPVISHVDAYWRDRRGELTVFTTGKKARATFEALFVKSLAEPLEQTLVRVDPPLMGLSRDQWEDAEVASAALGRLSAATPVAFAEQVYP